MGVPEPLDAIPTPLYSRRPVKILLLGGGELGKEVAIEAQRLGFEVVVVDRYDWAPAMHVAHRRYVVSLLDCGAIKAIVRREEPTAIIPEIEAVCVDALIELEEEGYNIVPNAKAVAIAMNRIELRRFAAEKLGLPTTRYAFAENEDEAYEACEKVGYPCLLKPEMSSSGHGHVKVNVSDKKRVAEAYRYAVSHARGASRRVIVEEYVQLETEFTVLAYRYVSGDGRVETDALPPVEHWRYGEFHYIESWQPSERPSELLERAVEIGKRVADALGGVGVFGVELLYTKDGRLLFSEVAPRPHDTGLVTLKSMELSEFAIHARASVGLPVPRPKLVTPAASYAVYTDLEGIWAPKVHGVYGALSIQGVDIRVFGKPVTYKGRRMAVVLATGLTVSEAREKARKAAQMLRVAPG
ncbi:Phosphoribosylaminoimidazole carboxylase [Pyrolobus fumarii 1A]|uniref:Formate-dependent phosphoribosylglycinamide formyltransferase n=1 Tax=Pyrolobus fumarii (strain DSM 11204 / 1A) TaxID=694429 RepID=G0ECB1_PYRF1|nr:formate-dependent phosphoribosylglycinamide formyltransferase [Pyrolobus fumarii]AEM39481.1 Phosphoribosylaminoimidazole carboxylase [Pyrolobus fumarii 1A]